MTSIRGKAVKRLSGVLIVLAAALAVGVAPAAAHRSHSGGRLTISPAPGTPDVEPHSQISLLNVDPRLIDSVQVAGSQSGAHPGQLRPYSGRRGASFLPSQPFTQGEHVSATVRLRGRSPIRFSFDVAHLGPIPPTLNLPQQQPAKLNHYTSRPDLLPPLITVNKGSSTPGGDMFLTPLPSPIVHPESNNSITITPVGPGGPMIVDPKGNVVWFKQLAPPDVAANLRIQRYLGRRVLTWWQGTVTFAAFGQGTGVIADSSYRTLATVQAGNGYSMDIHEFQLTHRHPLAASRRDRAGGGRPNRARGLGMARLRPHPAPGLLRHPGQQRLLRRLSLQLGPAAPGRAGACFGPRHLGRLQRRPRQWQDPLDPRRQGKRLRPRSRRPLLLPARRPDAP
jgi:hypothetical protein